VAALAGAKRRLNEKREPHHKARAHSVCRSTITKIRAMHIIQNEPARKAPRDGLPGRRYCETSSFEHAGADFTMSIGHYADGRVGEIFIGAALANSPLDALASDAAIAISFALQHGADLDLIRAAMKRNSHGQPSSPIGAALDRVTP
jgi:hypothetical protein